MKRQRFLMVAGVLCAAYLVWMLVEGASLYVLVAQAAPLGVMLAAAASQPMIALVCAGIILLMRAYSAVTSLISMIPYGVSFSWLVDFVISYAPILLISGMWVVALLKQRSVSASALLIAVAAAVFFFGREIYLGIRLGYGLSPMWLIGAARGALPYVAFALAAKWELSPKS